MKPWHFRHARALIYAGATVAAIAVAATAASDHWPDPGQTLVEARQLYGLWALALLLASMLLGPLTAVLPWLPLKPSLLYARRAVGVSALFLALLHVAAYLASVALRHWRELYSPGPLWVAGLLLGTLPLADLLALAFTSRDASVRRMGGRRWKRLHRTVYAALPLVLLHALLLGADFGLNHAPDVHAHPDFGSLLAFASLSIAWLTLLLLRKHRYALNLPRHAAP